MKPDITISETVAGFMRPRARRLTVSEGYDSPEEIKVGMRGPNGRHLGDFWTSKVNLVQWAKDIIAAYGGEEDILRLTPAEVIQLEKALEEEN